jgi:hypothetical protein
MDTCHNVTIATWTLTVDRTGELGEPLYLAQTVKHRVHIYRSGDSSNNSISILQTKEHWTAGSWCEFQSGRKIVLTVLNCHYRPAYLDI